MVYTSPINLVHISARNNEHDQLKILAQAANDETECFLDFKLEKLLPAVAAAFRDLLRSDRFDRTWTIWLRIRDPLDDASALALSQALAAGKIRILYPSIRSISDVLFRPDTSERLSRTLKKVILATNFHTEQSGIIAEWLPRLTSLEKLEFYGEYRSRPSIISQILQQGMIHQHLKKLAIEKFLVDHELVETLQAWSGLEGLDLYYCKFEDNLEFHKLTQLCELRIYQENSENEDAQLEASICSLLVQDNCQLQSLHVNSFGEEDQSGALQQLVDVVRKNKTLEEIEISSTDVSRWRPYLLRNKMLKQLMHRTDLPIGIWPHMLSRVLRSSSDSLPPTDVCFDVLYFFLREEGFHPYGALAAI